MSPSAPNALLIPRYIVTESWAARKKRRKRIFEKRKFNSHVKVALEEGEEFYFTGLFGVKEAKIQTEKSVRRRTRCPRSIRIIVIAAWNERGAIRIFLEIPLLGPPIAPNIVPRRNSPVESFSHSKTKKVSRILLR